jgi:hypothetical protein
MLNSGSGQLIKWSRKGLAELEKLLNINSSKPTASKPSLNLEAQMVSPPLPAPIPEPSAWIICVSLLFGSGLFRRLSARARD